MVMHFHWVKVLFLPLIISQNIVSSCLGTNQLIFSVVAGYIQIQWTKINSSVHQRTPMRIQQILRDMLFIGICRFITVILGLIAIKYIAVSLVATIKSSSPLFTVIISRIILREKTSKNDRFD